jgi:predicted KAP-like P-loop ATPase
MDADKNLDSVIDGLINTPVGRKILANKLKNLTAENRRLKYKIADTRIAVHTLNNMAHLLLRIAQSESDTLTKARILMSRETLKTYKELNLYKIENCGEEMMQRISNILLDTEGDDLLLADLFRGKVVE